MRLTLCDGGSIRCRLPTSVMKHDLRPEWGILRPLLFYIGVMIVLAWVGKTYFHMSMTAPVYWHKAANSVSVSVSPRRPPSIPARSK